MKIQLNTSNWEWENVHQTARNLTVLYTFMAVVWLFSNITSGMAWGLFGIHIILYFVINRSYIKWSENYDGQPPTR